MRLAWLPLLTAGLYAQDLGDLTTDRPGFTFSSGVMGLGALQMEQGYTFESARQGGSKLRTFSAPRALSIPARSSAFASSGHDPSVTLAAYKDRPSRFSVAVDMDMASITEGRGRIFSAGESLWAARNTGPVSIFAETFHTTVRRNQGSEVASALGLFRALGRHVQFDLEAGIPSPAPGLPGLRE